MSIYFRLCPEDAHTCALRACLEDQGGECPRAASTPTKAVGKPSQGLPVAKPADPAAAAQRAGDTYDDWPYADWQYD